MQRDVVRLLANTPDALVMLVNATVGIAAPRVGVEAAGLCRRRANPDDRRSQIIELTPAGRRLLAKATKSFEDELHIRLESVVTGRALGQFGATLTRLRAANGPVTSREEIPSAS